MFNWVHYTSNLEKSWNKSKKEATNIHFSQSGDNEEGTWSWPIKPWWMNPYSLKHRESLGLRNIESMRGSQLPSEGLMVSLWLGFQKWLCLVMISAVADLGVNGFECNLTDLLSAWPREHSHVPAGSSAHVVAGSTCPAWMASSFVDIHIQLTKQVS